MSETFINKLRTCCVSGHRIVKEHIDFDNLREIFINLIKKEKVNTFLIGMAIGFDTICFNILNEIKKEEPIRIIACVPCPNQSKTFNKLEKIEYNKNIKLADHVILSSEVYTPYCMFKRNKYMVDNSNYIVYYLRENKGGTKQTVEYAKKQGLFLIEF